ncbi:CGNR zinc finger domain-containing protein [Sphaerisporangium sp. TRM90804]|uniref:CGNR zinc finger domain-containing protein n=1 Tax=Sphaerisporangium sp. TRM90804 TaxID=3031113 RepID=UPI00244743A9|nr:CGNR zinc finger domain-containing protein [Sphaerisporangium sp. TRM90804]MDH2427770.1 CGNR zinc finger domain-containing protein [Sphaerisporangium sp. TRM90804]
MDADVDLTSYAELAVLLVNSGDALDTPEGAKRLLAQAGRARQAGRLTRADLEILRELRRELAAVFAAAARGDEQEAVDRLNSLLARHPVRPQLSRHDGQRWHLHLTEGGHLPDEYAAGAVMGLTALVTELGVDRLGACQAAPCRRAYLDTSSNRSRRYCSERCASRANVAAYRARRRHLSGHRG